MEPETKITEQKPKDWEKALKVMFYILVVASVLLLGAWLARLVVIAFS